MSLVARYIAVAPPALRECSEKEGGLRPFPATVDRNSAVMCGGGIPPPFRQIADMAPLFCDNFAG